MTFADLEPGDLFRIIPDNGVIPADAPVWKRLAGNFMHIFGKLDEQILAEGVLHVGIPEQLKVEII